jgi:hypothetical protein
MNGRNGTDAARRAWSGDRPSVLQRRKEVVAFIVGLALFAAGAVSLTRSHQRTAARPLEGVPPAGSAKPADARARPPVGPALGASIGTYVDQRRAALRKLATERPRDTSWAVVSFDSYREPDAVVSFLAGRGLHVAALQQRVPVSGFAASRVDVGDRRVGEALDAEAGEGLARRLDRERAALQRLLADVDDAAYRQVYTAEASRLAEATGALRTRPATVFALVVRAPNETLSRLAKVPGTRLVDVADAEAGPPGTSGFYGLLPDDVRIATFGSAAG